VRCWLLLETDLISLDYDGRRSIYRPYGTAERVTARYSSRSSCVASILVLLA